MLLRFALAFSREIIGCVGVGQVGGCGGRWELGAVAWAGGVGRAAGGTCTCTCLLSLYSERSAIWNNLKIFVHK